MKKQLPTISPEQQVDHQINYGGLEQLERVKSFGLRISEIQERIDYLSPLYK